MNASFVPSRATQKSVFHDNPNFYTLALRIEFDGFLRSGRRNFCMDAIFVFASCMCETYRCMISRSEYLVLICAHGLAAWILLASTSCKTVTK